MATAESTTNQQAPSKSLNLVQNQHNLNQNNLTGSMDPEPLDFDECLKDSPRFRQNLKENLSFIENLETSMTRAIKQINNYIESGRNHLKSQRDFISSLKTLNSCLGSRSSEVSNQVDTLLGSLEEIARLHEIVLDQSVRTVGTSFTRFINDDLMRIREARKSFDKISHEYDQALMKYSQPVKKQQDDSENLLIATSTAFSHTSLDLSIQLTALQSKKGYDILESLLSFTKAHSTFFHQGYELFEDLKPHISDMDEFLANLQDEFETLTRSLPSKHLLVSNNELRPLCFDNKAHRVYLEGYLFKRASNGFKVWNRRWFILKDHQLLYQKRGENQPTTMEEDLRLLTVRPVDKVDNDRRFCFEVLSPHKSHILQADSEAACKTWISAIQAGINAAFYDTEHKSIPRAPSSHELVSTASSSWGAGFSFKALSQQATNRLNSIATASDTKDISKHNAGDKSNRKMRTNVNTGSNDENDSGSDSSFRPDDNGGCAYAPLRDAEDDARDDVPSTGGKKVPSWPTRAASYPSPAGNIAPAVNPPGEPPAKPQRAYMKILAMPGNDACADCGASQPMWASINLGITLCIECAGIHRSLGVHLSKVRSLTLDTEVWSPEIVQLMLSLGNKSVNSAYLACLRSQEQPIDADSNREDRESWIKSKYLLKSFMSLQEDEKANEEATASAPTSETDSQASNIRQIEGDQAATPDAEKATRPPDG